MAKHPARAGPLHAGASDTHPSWRGRLLWICPTIGIIGGAGILWLFGFGIWTVVAFLFLIACPFVVVWALAIERRPNHSGNREP